MKQQIKKKAFKKCRFEKERESNLTQKEKKSNYKGWNWITISIKKRIRTTKNNNQKKKNHIWYKNKISRNEI